MVSRWRCQCWANGPTPAWYIVSVERVWSSGWGEGDLQGPAPHTDKRESNANPPRNALRTSKHRNALWWSVLEPDLYKCITAPWKHWATEGDGARRGKNAVYSYSIGSVGGLAGCAARDSRYLIGPNARNIDARFLCRYL